MAKQTATYHQGQSQHRTDWSSEITPSASGSRPASDTGLGGMERDWLMPSTDNGTSMNHSTSMNNGTSMNHNTSMNNGTSMALPDHDGMNTIWPNIENNLSNDVIEAPTTMDEVYRGSMKSLLLRNVGNYVVATFLIGTQTTVSWEGILYDVGNDYLAIYQSGRDQYIVSDLYSLKYVEFYDTRRRELCDSLLTAQEPTNNAERR